MAILLIIAACWIACGIGAWGFTFADSQRKGTNFDREYRRKDLAFASAWGLVFGPIALVLAFIGSGFGESGWRLR